MKCRLLKPIFLGANHLGRTLLLFLSIWVAFPKIYAETTITDAVYTFNSSSTPTGWAVSRTSGHASGYLKLQAGDYLQMTTASIFKSGEVLSSANMDVEVSCGTFGTWSGDKSVLCTVDLKKSDGTVLSTANATFSSLNNSETTYRTKIEVAKPSDPSQIAYLRITFSDFTTGTTLRVKNVRLNYKTNTSGECTSVPTVTAASKSSVTSTTATVTCSSGISSLGSAGCSISSYGFVIGTSSSPSIGGSGVTKHQVGTSYSTTGTSFYKDLTGLTPGETYYVRPYATNGKGDGYGTETSFTMLNEYTLTFKETNGTSNGSGKVVENATSFSYTTEPTAATGYEIDGFYKESSLTNKIADSSRAFAISTDYTDGSGKYTAGANHDLYLKWKAKKYTITTTLTNCSWSSAISSPYTYDGATNSITRTVNPNSGYGCPSTITVTMGGSTLTVSTDYTWSVTNGVGSFTLKKAITGNVVISIAAQPMVTWMAGGQVYRTQIGSSGTSLTNPGTPATGTYCDGAKTFVGWSATNIGSTPTNTEPTDLFSSSDATSLTIPASGATYYAVFATVTGTYGKFKRVTSSSASTDIAAGQQIAIVAYDDKKSSWHILGINAAGTAYADASAPSETSSQIDTPAKRFIWTVSKSSSSWVFTNKNTTTKKIATNSTSGASLDFSTQTYTKWDYGTNSAGTNTFYLVQNGTTNGLERYNTAWKTYNGEYSTGAAFQLKFYVPNYTASAYVTTCGTTYTVTKGTESGGTFTVSPTTAIEDATITLKATPSADYRFESWAITSSGGDITSSVSLSGQTADATFSMPAANVTVTPTFVAKCQTPTFSVSEGTYNNDQSVTITCATSDVTIYYTTNGSTPTTSSSVYSGAITINADNTTLKAIAVKASHENSEVASATYRLKCATPTFTASPGLVNSKYLGTQTVTLSSTTTGSVTYYYTTNNSTPTTGSTEYDDGIEVSSTATVKAIATKSGYQNSDVGSASYTITTAYTVTWYNKGSQLTTTRVESGEKPTFPADSKSGCGSYTYFYGWAEADFTTPVTTPTTSSTIKVYRAASEMPAVSADKSYYAVWGDKVASVTHTLTASSSWSGYTTGTLDDDQSATWSYYAAGTSYDTKYWLGLNSNAQNYNIESPTFSGNVQSIKAFIRNASSTEARSVYVCSSDETAQPSSGDLGSCSVAKSNESELTFSISGTFKKFYIYTSAALTFHTITVVEGATDVKCVTNCCLDLDDINGDKTDLVYNGVTLTWDDIAHVTCWTVTGKDGEDNAVAAGNIGMPTDDGDTYSCAITGLKQYTDYTFTITPTQADGYCETYDEVTFKTPCVAPSSLSIAATGSKWDYCEGESMTLTVSGTNVSASATYQWQKHDGSTWNDIDGATSASYTVASMAASNAGQYRCTVTNPGSSCEATSSGVWVRLWQLYINNGTADAWQSLDISNTGTGTGSNTTVSFTSDKGYKFKLKDNNGGWFGLDSKTITATESNITLNGSGDDVNITSGLEGNYTFAINYSNKDNPKVSVTYPVANQPSGRKIWFDKSVITGWTTAGTSDLVWRIGKKSNSMTNQDATANAFALVPGTDRFYVYETKEYNGFEAWHIANNVAWSGDSNNDPAYDNHGIYTHYHDQSSTDVTYATVYQKYVIGTDGVTLVPTTKKNTDWYCDFWNVTKTDGMLKHTAEISSYSHGTVTVSYTKYDGTGAASFTSGSNDDLAHRCILTITAVADAGYQLTSLQVNSAAFTSGNTHVLAADATITAVFAPQTSTVTLKPNGGSGSDQTVTATYDAAMPSTLSGGGAIVKPSRDHYSFTGYFDNTSGGTQYYTNTLASANTWDKTGAQNLYAQWQGDSYTITFKDKGNNAYSGSNGGSLPTSHTYGAATALVDGVKTGYHFDGWFDNSSCTGTAVTSIGATAITANTTYYAKWTIENYSVTWKVNGESYSTGTPSDNADYNTKVSTLPTAPSAPEGCSDKVFKGWSESNLGKTTGQGAPADLFTTAEGSPAITSATIFYAVFADETPESTTTTWTKTSNTSDLETGTYAILTHEYKAFTGTISSGHGAATSGTFSFTNNVATSAPDGMLEVTITRVAANQFRISRVVDVEDVPTTQYLHATKCQSGGLAWSTETGANYWFNNSTGHGIRYSVQYDYSKTPTYPYMLSTANDSNPFRTSGADGTNSLWFAKKGSVVTPASYSNYVTECDEPAECGTPTFSVDEGTYNETQTVTISTVTDGATIRYTTDGTDPTSSKGTVYSEPVEISCSTTLKAIAYKAERDDSEVGSIGITIKVPNPTFSINSGTYYAVQNVTLSCDMDGSTIYYTTTSDGSEPTTPTSSSTEYTGAINIPANSTIKVSAIAIKDGCATASDVVTKTYVVRVGTNYTLVTDVNNLFEGDKVVILSDNGSTRNAVNTYAGGNDRPSTNDFDFANNERTAVTVYPLKVGDTYTVQVFELQGEPGAWVFKAVTDDTKKYLGLKDDNNYLKTYTADSDDQTKWTISISEGIAHIANKQRTTRYIEYNSSGSKFACYTSNQTARTKIYSVPNPNPVIKVEASLSAFSTSHDQASDAQSFYVSGKNLSASIRVTAPTGYEVSLSSGSGYADYIDIERVGTTVSRTQVYVRIKTGQDVGSPSDNVVVSVSADNLSKSIAVSGTVSCADPGLAFAGDIVEELTGSSVVVSNAFSTLSAGTLTYTITPKSGSPSDGITFNTSTKTITVTKEGEWNITLNQTAGGNYCADEATCTVLVECGTPAAPTGLDVSESNTQATISWDAVDGADHYDVIVTGNTSGGDESYNESFENITSTSTIVTGLKAGCTYEYIVTVTNTCGQTEDSDDDEFTTLPYSVTYHSATETDYALDVISGESVSAHGTDDCDNGKVFVGWTTSAVDALQQTDPTTNTTGAIASVTANTDLYAVFAAQNGYTTATILDEKWNVVEWDGTNKIVGGAYSSWATNFADAPSTSFKISGTSYQAIVFDVSSARTITSESAYSNLKAIQITGSNRSSFAMNVTVKVSANKSDWTTVDTKSLGTASNSSPQTLVFALGTKGDYYVRIETQAKSSGNKTGITNIRLYQEQDYYLTDYSTTCTKASSPAAITWENGGGSLADGSQPTSATVGNDITMPTLTKADYRFDGWKATINSVTKTEVFTGGDKFKVNHPVTFTAQWTQVFSISSPTDGLTSYKDIQVTSTSQTFTTVGMHNAVPSITVADDTYFSATINSHEANSSDEDYSYTFTYQPNAFGTGSGAATNTTTATVMDARTGVVSSPITLRGRSLPEEFVIAIKKDNQWVALPNNLASTSSQPSIVPLTITVNDADIPTEAVYAPATTIYKAMGRGNVAHNTAIRFTTTGSNYLQVSGSSEYNMWLSTTNSANVQDWQLKSSDFNSYELSIPSNSATKKMGIYNSTYMGYHGSPNNSAIYLLPVTNTYTEIAATVHEWGEHGVIIQPTTPSDLSSVTSATMNVGTADPTAATATAVNVAMGTAKYVRVYAAGVTVGGVANEGKQLYVHWKNEGGSEIGVSQVTIPCVVATSNDMHSIADTKAAWAAKSEVHVLPGVTLEANASSFSGDGALSVSKMEIYPGATLKVSTGTFNATTLRLRCGWTRAGDKKYDVARVYIADDAALTKTTASMDYDIYEKSDGKHYYPLAVPFKTQVSTVDYADEALATASIYGKHIGIDKYDGASRATSGATDGNWVQMTTDEYLEPGKGYTITAVSSKGSAIIRVPLVFDNGWTADGEKATIDESYHKNQVSVTAYSGAASTGGGANNRNAGWNMLGVPYMSCFDASDASADPSDAFIKGMLNFLTGEYTESANVYVNVPVHDFSEYIQKPVSEAKLLPGWSFFVQIGKNGTLSFATAGQEPSSTLPIYAPQREDMPVVKTGIVLSRGDKSDNTTLLISDKYSANEYEINADLEKMFGNGYTLATYSLSQNTRLAYNAMSTTDARQVIPIGFRAPEDGEYTFSLNPRYADAAVERVDLIDYQTGEVTNLMMSEYTFTTVRTQDDERFALNVVPRAEVPTGVDDNSQKSKVESRKIVIDDHVFIIHDGLLYDATGKRVKQINK